MINFIKIDIIENVLEANLLKGILADRKIPCLIKSYQDSAYNGLFQMQKGWGALYAPKENESEVKIILSDLRKDPQE